MSGDFGKQAVAVNYLAVTAKNPAARIMQRLRPFWLGLHARGDHFKNKEVVALDQRIIIQTTLKAGVAFRNARRSDLHAFFCRKIKMGEFIGAVAATVADAGDDIRHAGVGQINHTFAALAD